MTTDERVAIVTGAARGMGFAIARQLARSGRRVVLADVQAQALEEAVARLRQEGGWAEGCCADLAEAQQARELVSGTAERCGRLDILVNNAGVLRPTRLPDISLEEWEWILRVNLTAPFLLCQAALPPMKAGGFGRIVNLSSTAGKTVSTLGGAHYTASKSGLLGLTRAVAHEAAPFGITCNAVCPGLIDTEMVRATIPAADVAAYERSFPIPRLGQPSEVAALVAFLCSEEAGYVTGAAFDITGGDLMV